MSLPSVSGLEKITRILIFVAGRPRVVWEHPNQDHQEANDIYVDTNWAGCWRTRKSTSGGCAMLGRHCIKAWSKTQSIIATSSGESELFGVIKRSAEGLGLITLAKDFGVEIATRVHVDATAAKGMKVKTWIFEHFHFFDFFKNSYFFQIFRKHFRVFGVFVK